MNVIEMFENACKAWGVEIVTVYKGDDPSLAKKLLYGDKVLVTHWCPEVLEDLTIMHGRETAEDMVEALLMGLMKELLPLTTLITEPKGGFLNINSGTGATTQG